MAPDGIDPTEVLDVEGTLTRLGGDRKLFAELGTFLLEDAPLLLASIRKAALTNDVSALENQAHALKGLLSNCGGSRAARVAQALEDACHSSNSAHRTTLVGQLTEELAKLIAAIRVYQP